MLGTEGMGHTPVPYDFDFSGLINAKYAVPPEGIKIQSVRTRMYRGFCKSDMISLNDAKAAIQENKQALYSLLETNSFTSDRAKKRSAKYLDSYFKISENDKRFEKSVLKKCRGKK